MALNHVKIVFFNLKINASIAAMIIKSSQIKIFFNESLNVLKRRYMNYYYILDVDPNASLTEIKKAYKNKCNIYHPDIVTYSKNKTEKIQKINEAYAVLKDSVKRNEHDKKMNTSEYSSKIEKTFQKTSKKKSTPIFWKIIFGIIKLIFNFIIIPFGSFLDSLSFFKGLNLFLFIFILILVLSLFI